MSRLTVNESISGYTDEIILTPNDVSDTSGTSKVINLGIKKGDVVYGAAIETVTAFAGTGTTNVRVGTDTNVAPDDDTSIMENVVVSAANTAANTGDNLDGTTADFIAAAADGNVEITIAGASALSSATAGKVRVLLGIRRINA
jgi:DNA-binding protein YbaB